MLSKPPAFVGKIRIDGDNNQIYWTEASLLSATLSLSGLQYPDAIASDIATQMTAESAASGSSYTYTASFSVETGKVTLTSTGSFSITNTTSQSNAIWSGGSLDSNGVALTNEQYGPEHLGWKKTSTVTTGTEHTSDIPVGAYFSPSRPVYQDTEDPYQATVAVSKSEGGTAVAYDFTPVYTSTSDFLGGGYNATRSLFLGDLTDDDRLQWALNFWRLCRGRVFRFYKQRTVAENREYILTQDSARESGFSERRPSVRLWSGTIQMQRVKSQLVQLFTTEGRDMPQNQALLDNWELVHPSTGPVALSQFQFDPSDWQGSRSYSLVVTMYVSGATAGSGLTGRIKLRNITDGEDVSSTTLDVTATSPTTVTSGALTVGAASGNLKASAKTYELRLQLVGSADTTDTVQVGTAYIKVD